MIRVRVSRSVSPKAFGRRKFDLNEIVLESRDKRSRLKKTGGIKDVNKRSVVLKYIQLILDKAAL